MERPGGVPRAEVQPGVASGWGLASLLIGCTTLLLLPPLVLVLLQVAALHSNPAWTGQQQLTIANVGLLATLVPMAMTAAVPPGLLMTESMPFSLGWSCQPCA